MIAPPNTAFTAPVTADATRGFPRATSALTVWRLAGAVLAGWL